MGNINVTDNIVGSSSPLRTFRVQAIVVAILAFVLYGNTWKNEYALDDTVVLIQNEYVLEGINGLRDIFTKDSYDSYYKQTGASNQVVGGRYRPLSIATFAIEQEFFSSVPRQSISKYFQEVSEMMPEEKAAHEQKLKSWMHTRHLVNVLLYALSAVVLLFFLRKIVFRNDYLMPLLASVFFVIHPLHTEVVANIKSRDEILSFLFILVTFILAFKYRETGKIKHLLLALLAYFLAFLSKEYAISLLALLPLSFYLFGSASVKKSIWSTWPYLIVAIVYVVIRIQLINAMPDRLENADNDIQINPYAYANETQKVATEIATPLNYLRLLFIPQPLSSDYSYNSIPYKDLSHPLVWLSILVHATLVFLFFYTLRKKHILSFAIAFYLANLALVCNLFFNIGATMGERLIYHSSLGFAIAISYLVMYLAQRSGSVNASRIIAGSLMILLVILCGFQTIRRNADWKNDTTLFANDINVVPNSFLVNANVATTLVNNAEYIKDRDKKRADLRRGAYLFTKAINMQDTYVMGYMNRSIAYMRLGETDSMVMDLDKVRQIYPVHPQLPLMYVYAGQFYFAKKEYIKAYGAMQVALGLIPDFYPARNEIRIMDSSMAAMGLPRPVATP